MDNGVKTSVVIPIYNTQEYLETCIESVIAQTQREIEIILIDDGSIDNSRKIIEKYEKKYSFIKAVFQKNKRQGAARNKGAEMATGRYIYFLDSDDYISKTLLEECYERAEKDQLDFVMFDPIPFMNAEEEALKAAAAKEIYDRRKLRIKTKVYSGIEFWNTYYSHNGIYVNPYLVYINADFLRENNLFFEPEIYYEDNDWMVRMYLCAERIEYIPQSLYYRRFRMNSVMTENFKDIHLVSSIVQCRKLLQLLLVVQREPEKVEVVQPILKGLLFRFNDIFLIYCKNKRLMSVQPIVLEFYEHLLNIYKDIYFRDIKTVIMAITKTVKCKLQEFGNKVKGGNLDKDLCQVMQEELRNYPLDKEEVTIGIYGTGSKCDEFLYLYRNYVGDILATIFFVDTYKESGSSYQGYSLYNICDLKEEKMDYIIIASTRYKTEMQENIRRYLEEKVEVLFLPDFLYYLSVFGTD